MLNINRRIGNESGYHQRTMPIQYLLIVILLTLLIFPIVGLLLFIKLTYELIKYAYRWIVGFYEPNYYQTTMPIQYLLTVILLTYLISSFVPLLSFVKFAYKLIKYAYRWIVGFYEPNYYQTTMTIQYLLIVILFTLLILRFVGFLLFVKFTYKLIKYAYRWIVGLYKPKSFHSNELAHNAQTRSPSTNEIDQGSALTTTAMTNNYTQPAIENTQPHGQVVTSDTNINQGEHVHEREDAGLKANGKHAITAPNMENGK
ncbi:unnamed protein product [Rotaria sp. Silwood2]|nr:unnamed protein product [Rotaria sp. Silwood2]CAF4396059.1 unnamed protein product [Rotaria sp. Silwood2]